MLSGQQAITSELLLTEALKQSGASKVDREWLVRVGDAYHMPNVGVSFIVYVRETPKRHIRNAADLGTTMFQNRCVAETRWITDPCSCHHRAADSPRGCIGAILNELLIVSLFRCGCRP